MTPGETETVLFPHIPLGFGVSGAHGLPILSSAKTIALIHLAYELGIRYFDTAPTYGNGEAERRLGAALKTLPSDVIISTKVGLVPRGWRRPINDFTPEAVRTSLSASMQRLGLSRLPLLMLNGADTDVWWPDHDVLLAELLEQGLVDRFGVVSRGEAWARLPDIDPLSVLMTPLSDLDHVRDRPEPKIALEVLRSAVPAYPTPTSAGRLFRLARSLRRQPDSRPQQTIADALNHALSAPGVIGAMVTTTRPDHLKELVDIARHWAG